MNRIQRCLAVLAGFGGALLTLAAAAPAACATRIPPPGDTGGPATVPPPAIHTVVTGGMPGWQITLIAAGAALLGAVLAVLLDRKWAARRRAIARTA